MYDGNNNFENERVRYNKLKREIRKRHISETADEGNQIRFKCDICNQSKSNPHTNRLQSK